MDDEEIDLRWLADVSDLEITPFPYMHRHENHAANEKKTQKKLNLYLLSLSTIHAN